MACTACQELRKRVEQLESFVAAADAKLLRVRSTSVGAAGWPSDWPQPTETTSSRASAFRRGVLAFRAGEVKTACPYTSGSRGHDNAWTRGWIAAKRTWGIAKPAKA